jgi:pimeloyl-ACP methyl ester carboxylesterase
MVVLAVLAVVLGWAGLRAAQAYCAERQAFHPQVGPVALPSPPLAGSHPVEFGAGVRGWWVAPRNGHVVIFLHGSNGDRTQLLPEARLLAARGFGALLYDSPGHAESAGRVLWGEPERQALRAAVDFAAEQEGVKAIGGLGFSMGAYVLAQTASHEPRLSAAVLESCFADSDQYTRWEYRLLGFVQQWPAFLAQRQAGFVSSEEQPIASVRHLAPRRLLIISGMDDTAVTPAMAHQLFAAAGSPRELWLVPGAGHGNFADAAADYPDRLAAFFRDGTSAR